MTDVDALLSRADASLEGVTEGPWQWGGCLPFLIDLRSMTPGRPFVMTFGRMGMQGAQPRFAVGRNSDGKWNDSGVMTDAKDLAVMEVEYRGDIVGIDHPDARFIAESRSLVPELRDALKAATEVLEAIEARAVRGSLWASDTVVAITRMVRDARGSAPAATLAPEEKA